MAMPDVHPYFVFPSHTHYADPSRCASLSLCVPPPPLSASYYVLSGQHTVGALKELRRLWLVNHTSTPPWLDHIEAAVLKFSVPVKRRRELDGNLQHRQHQTAPLLLNHLLRWLFPSTTTLASAPSSASSMRWRPRALTALWTRYAVDH